MKRLTICVLFVLLSACNESRPYPESTCGNGVLDEKEACDGNLFQNNLKVVCDNGMSPQYSQLKCTDSCTIDASRACESFCSNGVIEPGEECDGYALPTVKADCENPDMSKLSCSMCHLVDNGVCGETVTPQPDPKCGNGKLDADELCDGTLFKADAKTCPSNMALRDASKFKCLSSCRLVDVTEACEFQIETETCGNGQLDDGEFCDGSLISDRIEFEPCPDRYKQDPSNLKCTSSCEIDASNLCVPDFDTPQFIILSEIVPFLEETGSTVSMTGLAFEYTNMGTKAEDVTSCSLHIYEPTGASVKEYKFSDLGIQSLDAGETIVICSQKSDHYEGVCNYTVSDDLIQANISAGGFMALECGGSYIDILNLNSFLAAVNNGALDFVRFCNQLPIAEPANALLGEGWSITALTNGAPVYGLGEHCISSHTGVESCTYTIDRTTLTDRSQIIRGTLEVKIPGITDETEKTDTSSSVAIRFVAGDLKDDKVTLKNIHIIWPDADSTWTNSDGIDRYVGILHNYDTYEGFLESDVGSYVLDAAISFDNEQTWTYCGPKGIIEYYEDYRANQRNRLDVSYEKSTCGDGVITGSEVCDGNIFIEDALVCEDSQKVVTDRSKLKCYTCGMLGTAAACNYPPENCGNNRVDTGEVCDGTNLPESAAVCPDGMIPKNGAKFACNDTCTGINVTEACEFACGNGKIDEGEACDGDAIDHTQAEATCKGDTKYLSSRAQCNACKVSKAACVPNTQLVFDQFLVHYNDSNKADGVAIAINYYGDAPLDTTYCTLWLLDKNGKTISNGSTTQIYHTAFPFTVIQNSASDTSSITPCKPLILCSETTSPESEYKKIFGKCDATLTLADDDGYIDNILITLDKIEKLQITCGGDILDTFDFAGLREAFKDGITHGILKNTDKEPWPDIASVSLEDRMTLDKTANTFTAPTCE